MCHQIALREILAEDEVLEPFGAELELLDDMTALLSGTYRYLPIYDYVASTGIADESIILLDSQLTHSDDHPARQNYANCSRMASAIYPASSAIP